MALRAERLRSWGESAGNTGAGTGGLQRRASPGQLVLPPVCAELGEAVGVSVDDRY